MKHLKQCPQCNRKVFRLAVRVPKPLCATCYYHSRRDIIREQLKHRKPCSIQDCGAPSVAKGYCDKHYRRLVRDGTPTPDRAENWGHSHGHPLYDRWRSLNARRHADVLAPEWRDNFWQFVRDIGDPPTSRHTLKRKDLARPFGVDNFYWKEPFTDVVFAWSKRNSEYDRMRRASPDYHRRGSLRKMYGLTLEQYEAMEAEQNRLCAICRKPETKGSAAQDGTKRKLSVDHCHNSKRVRGLLCSSCNVMLGYANEDADILKSAIAYLKKHAKK